MKKVIVTGFEPFGPYNHNPVQDAALEYDGKRIEDMEVTGLVLPCTYYGAFELLSEKIDELSPDIIVSSGLSSIVPRIRLESMGRNIMNGKYADAEGKKPDNEPIVQGGDSFYPVNTFNIPLANALYKEGISSDISVDADGFICNSFIYLTARRILNESLPIKFAFFHIPWTEDYADTVDLEPGKTTIPKEDLGKTIEILIKEMAK